MVSENIQMNLIGKLIGLGLELGLALCIVSFFMKLWKLKQYQYQNNRRKDIVYIYEWKCQTSQ